MRKDRKSVPDNASEITRLMQVYKGYRDKNRLKRQWAQDNTGNKAILRERNERIRIVLKEHGFFPLKDRCILDVGCGYGHELGNLVNWGASPINLYGIDLIQDRIDAARAAYQEIHFECQSATVLNHPDSSLDLVMLYTVYSSILSVDMLQEISSQVRRVLKLGGAIIWYDFRYNNPQNANVRGMTKNRIRSLFSGFEIHLHTVTLLPPLARRLGRLTPLLYPLFSMCSFMRTHYLGLLIKTK